MIYILGLECGQCKYTDTYEEKITTMNLYIIKIIAHEIEHVLQEIKINSRTSNIESDILNIAMIHEKNLKLSGTYNDILYYVNPIERQAELKSLKTVLQIAKEINNLNVFELIKDEYLTKTLCDYSFEKQRNRYPYQIFFNKNSNINYILNIIRKIEEMKILDCNKDLRINMGLKLTFQEVYNIKRKLND